MRFTFLQLLLANEVVQKLVHVALLHQDLWRNYFLLSHLFQDLFFVALCLLWRDWSLACGDRRLVREYSPLSCLRPRSCFIQEGHMRIGIRIQNFCQCLVHRMHLLPPLRFPSHALDPPSLLAVALTIDILDHSGGMARFRTSTSSKFLIRVGVLLLSSSSELLVV